MKRVKRNVRARVHCSDKRRTNTVFRLALLVVLSISTSIILFDLASATPEGPTFAILGNSTRNASATAQVNDTEGGFIYTVQVNATTQNTRWKAFVGNVSGSLVLDDADSQRIFAWNLSSTVGEVYATRNDSTITWNSVECANETDIGAEDAYLGHTQSDNISSTFNQVDHTQFLIGSNVIAADTCFSIHTYVNSTAQTTSFQEVVTKDPDGGEIIFVSTLEDGISGYNNQPYDFQMILPENGTQGWIGSIAYYFYVELE